MNQHGAIFFVIQIVLAAYASFALWMVLTCVYGHEEKKERLAWFVFFLFLWFVAAPIYFFASYLPRTRQRKAEAKALVGHL
jgi:hypothetical protein